METYTSAQLLFMTMFTPVQPVLLVFRYTGTTLLAAAYDYIL